MLNYSISKRSIYPGMDLDRFQSETQGEWTQRSGTEDLSRKWWRDTKSRHKITRKDTNKHEDQNQTIFRTTQQLFQLYQEENHRAVISKGVKMVERIREELSKRTNSTEESQLKEALSKVKKTMGNAYIKRFRKLKDKKMLQQAKKLLRQENQESETPHSKAKRFNNFGLCELLLGRYANAFEYFSKAFELYRSDGSLNMLGLIRNIAEMYIKWQMFEEAAKFYEYLIQENDKKGFLTLKEESTVMSIILKCINTGGDLQTRKAMFHRANKLVRRLGQKRGEDCLKMELKVELVRYGVKRGVQEGDISRDELEKVVKDVEGHQSEDYHLVLLKANCLLSYRQLFEVVNWDKYLQVSKYVQKLFDSVASSK